MIGANYVSAWVGGGMALAFASKLNWNLYNGWQYFWLLVAVAYVITLLLEWPFLAACFWGEPGWVKRSFKASVLVHTASYLVIFGWYWVASGKSLYTRMNVVPLAEMKLPAGALLYFIGSQDGRIYEMDLGSQGHRAIGEVTSTNWNDRLLFRAQSTNDPSAELCLRREVGREAVIEIIAGDFLAANVAAEAGLNPPHNLWFNFGRAAVLRGATNSGWQFRSGFWPVAGMTASSRHPGEGYRFGWETPFSQWTVRSVTHLPGDVVIFQFGRNQICILDAPTRRIARIVEGRGLAVALKSAEVSAR